MSSVAGAFLEAVEAGANRPFLQLVSDTARRYGIPPGSLTYAETWARAASLLASYRALLGDRRNGAAQVRVALALDNRPEFFSHWLALNSLGVSVVPLNPLWQSAELAYVLNHSDARLAVVLPERLGTVQASAQDAGIVLSVDDISTDSNSRIEPCGKLHSECALLYTSGTTGKPKGCLLSNEYFLTTGAWYRNVDGYCTLTPGQDRLLTPLPMYHMNAMATSTMAMIMTGSCVVPLDRFHPGSWWQSVAECDATIIHYLGVMPAMLMNLPEQATDTRHNIRFGFGAGLSGELHRAFEARFGMQLIEAWAMTETGCTVAVIASEEPRKVGTACFGRPPAHMDYRLVDDAGCDSAPGTPGELLVRRFGANPRQGFFSGYLKDAAATEAAWSGGYFHTGDLVCVDTDGLMHFVDRKKNVIRRSGENISAVEVEEVLIEHPQVGNVGVAAVPDPLRGDEVCACLVAVTPPDDAAALAAQVVQHCLARLAYFKAPGYVAFVDALPRTATEKIQRTALKALAAQHVHGGTCIDTRDMKLGRG